MCYFLAVFIDRVMELDRTVPKTGDLTQCSKNGADLTGDMRYQARSEEELISLGNV